MSARVEAVEVRPERYRWVLLTDEYSTLLCDDHSHDCSYLLRHCERAAANAGWILTLYRLGEVVVAAAKKRGP